MPGFVPPQQHTKQDDKVQHMQAGIWWPAADSDRLRAAARAWRDMAHALERVQIASQSAALNVAADNDGRAMAAFGAYWQKWTGANGYLPSCSQACLAMADALDQYAKAVDEARQQVERLVAEVATAVVIGVALSVLTVGISDVAAGAGSAGSVVRAAGVGGRAAATAAIAGLGGGGAKAAGSWVVLHVREYGQVAALEVAAGGRGGAAGGEIGGRRIRVRLELTNLGNDDLSAIGSDLHPNVPAYDGPPA